MRSVSFKGVWYGLSQGTRRAALGYAVIEGVAFALLDGYRALRAAGTNVQMVFLVGGGSKSCYWTSLLANALRLPLRRQSGSDLGAARMGMMASNPTADVGTNCVVPPVVDVIEPRLDLSDAMQSRFGRFRKLYIALRPSFSD